MKRIFLLLAACAVAATALAQDTVKLVPALGWDVAEQGGFPVCIAQDAQNAIWVGTEGKGVWRFDPRKKKWTQFLTKDGLGDDDVYALAVDNLNRVWAGHLNHGASVWNGEKWKNYGLLDGPLGDRVFAIAICPYAVIGHPSGDVWIATDLGVARYSTSEDDWDYYTRASGLPSDQIQSIAFTPDGHVVLGTQCDGVAIGDAQNNYKTWRVTKGPLQMPNTALGQGLPSNLINDVVVGIPPPGLGRPPGMDAEMTLMGVATPCGVGGSADGGNQWMFFRGANWQENLNGLYDPPATGNANFGGELLKEDWVAWVREDLENNRLWIGYYRDGIEARNLDDGKVALRVDNGGAQEMFVRAIFLPPKSSPLFAVCDPKTGGLKTLASAEDAASIDPGNASVKSPVAFPAAAKVPTVASFQTLEKRVAAFKNRLEPGEGVYLGDDWCTGGDWVEHYGGSFAKLCGMNNGKDRNYETETGYDVQIRVGPHQKDTDVRRHVAVAKTDDRRMLYDPTLGHRRAAEVNDLASDGAYPPDWEGPDLWVDLKFPEGIHCVSLYLENYLAHTELPKQYRDFDVQLLPWSDDQDKVQKAEPIARTRAHDFLGGVYKQFVVCGPSRYVIRIGRNHSFATKLQGVFIDRLTAPAETADVHPLPGFGAVAYEPPEEPAGQNLGELAAAARDLWLKLDSVFDQRGAYPLQLPFRIWAYRAAVAGNAPAELLKRWRWQIGIWLPEDRREFDDAMKSAFDAYSTGQPEAPPDDPEN